MRKEMLVGIVFVVATAIAVFGTVVVSGLDVFARKTYWVVEFGNVSGIQTGDDVQVLGYRMGSVYKISLDRGRHVFRVTLRMDARTPIYEDYRIAVRESSALGGKFLAINPGDPAKAPADPGKLVGQSAPTDIMASLSDVAADLKQIVANVNAGKGTLGQLITKDDVYRDLKTASGSLKTVLERVENGQGSAGKFLTDESLYKQLNDVATRLSTGNNAVARLLRDESGGMVEDVRSAVSSVKSITAKIDQGEGSLGRFVNDPKLYENAAAAAANASSTLAGAGDLVQEVRSGRGIAGMLVTDDKVRERTSQVIENMQAVTQRVREGEGSAGKFVADPQLYDELVSFARHLSSASDKIDTGAGTVAKLINDNELHERAKRLVNRAIDAMENARDTAPVSGIISFLIGPFQ